MPDEYLQQPWRWSAAGSVLGTKYAAPVVDVADSARQARERVWGLRKGGAFAAEAARVARKHASRKDRSGHFVNDREALEARTSRKKPKERKARRGSADDRQLGLDL